MKSEAEMEKILSGKAHESEIL